MVVVTIIGLLVALAVPAYKRTQYASQNSRVTNDFRVFAQAFEIYHSVNATWPGNVAAGVIPISPVPMNGNFGFSADISISGFTCDDAQLTEIDAKLDDGDLTAGNFRKVAPNRVTLILEQ